MRDEASKTLTLTVETDKQRTGNFRLFVPEAIDFVKWNEVECFMTVDSFRASARLSCSTRPFKNDRLQVKFATCASRGLPAQACLAV